MRRLAHGSGLESAQHGGGERGDDQRSYRGQSTDKVEEKGCCLPQQQCYRNRNRHNSHDNYNGLMIPVYTVDQIL